LVEDGIGRAGPGDGPEALVVLGELAVDRGSLAGQEETLTVVQHDASERQVQTP
jgi:hypothetical protein